MSNSRNRSRKIGKKDKAKKPKEEQISFETFAWCDPEGFRLDINDPISPEEYENLFNKKEIYTICLEKFNKIRRIVKISCKQFFYAKCIYIYMLIINHNFKYPNFNGDLDIVCQKIRQKKL